VKIQTDLDRLLATQRGQKGELDCLREELKVCITGVASGSGKLGKRTSELEDSELQKRKDSERQKRSSELEKDSDCNLP